MEISEAKENLNEQLENTKQANKCGLATKGEFNEEIEAIETILKALEDKDKEITDMREIFVKTAKHQEKLGHFELAEYMLAQIEATPTFTTWEEYKTWVSKEKIRDKIGRLEKEQERVKNNKLIYSREDVFRFQIYILEELLEEE